MVGVSLLPLRFVCFSGLAINTAARFWFWYVLLRLLAALWLLFVSCPPPLQELNAACSPGVNAAATMLALSAAGGRPLWLSLHLDRMHVPRMIHFAH